MDYLVLHIADRPTLSTIFSDVELQSNMQLVNEKYKFNNSLEKLICRIHRSGRINSVINLPGKQIWEKKSTLLTMDYNPENEYYIVFLEAAAIQYTIHELSMLQSKQNVHLCLLLFNPLKDVLRLKKFSNLYHNFEFEKVYAIFDEDDIQQRGMHRINAIYSKHDLVCDSKKLSDCFFVGLAKDRQNMLEKLYKKCCQGGANCDFTIVNPTVESDSGITYTSGFMDYDDYLQHLSNTNCIIEIVQGIQKGMTLRTFEAIVYGKRLLTNNKYIMENPFYDARYMKYFENIDDIDVDFITSVEKADYGYHDEFSPKHLLEQVKEAFEA